MKVVKLVWISGNLTVTLPRDLVRELALHPRMYVGVERAGDRKIRITVLEVTPDDRSSRGRDSARPGR